MDKGIVGGSARNVDSANLGFDLVHTSSSVYFSNFGVVFTVLPIVNGNAILGLDVADFHGGLVGECLARVTHDREGVRKVSRTALLFVSLDLGSFSSHGCQ